VFDIISTEMAILIFTMIIPFLYVMIQQG